MDIDVKSTHYTEAFPIAPLTVNPLTVTPISVHLKELNQVAPLLVDSLRVDHVRHIDPQRIDMAHMIHPQRVHQQRRDLVELLEVHADGGDSQGVDRQGRDGKRLGVVGGFYVDIHSSSP